METCKKNHILLSLGLIYILATIFYFITKKIQNNELLDLSIKIPKLKTIYDNTMKKQIKLFYLGLIIASAIVYWIRPFQFCVIQQ